MDPELLAALVVLVDELAADVETLIGPDADLPYLRLRERRDRLLGAWARVEASDHSWVDDRARTMARREIADHRRHDH